MNDGLGDRGAEFRHALGEPQRNTPTVKRQICKARSFHPLALVLLHWQVQRYVADLEPITAAVVRAQHSHRLFEIERPRATTTKN